MTIQAMTPRALEAMIEAAIVERDAAEHALGIAELSGHDTSTLRTRLTEARYDVERLERSRAALLAMRNVNSIAGLTPAQFQKVKASVLDMSRSTAQAPKVLADGLYQIYSSGIKGEGALKVLKASAVAASAGLTDTGTAATAIVGVLNAYHLSADQAARVSDILFQTVNRGVITFPELANTIGTVLPFASALHISLNDVGAAISTLTKEGIPAHTATTDLKNAMSAFLKPSDAMAASIKKTGFESGEALVKSKGFEGALKAVANTTDGSKAALNKLFPDIRATTAAFDLTGKSAQSATDELDHFTNSAVKGAAAKVYAEQAKSAGFQIQQLGANLSHAAIVLGAEFLPELNKGAVALSKFLNGQVKHGNIQALGDDIKQVFGETTQVVGDFVHVGGQVIGTIADIAGALGSLAGVDLGNPSQIEAIIAAYLGFKAVQIVGPILIGLAQNIRLVAVAAQEAGGIKSFFAILAENGVAGPIGLAAGAVAILTGAIVLLSGHEKSAADAAKDVASASRDEAAAIAQAADSALAAADAHFAAEKSDIALAKAKRATAKAAKDYGTDSKQYQSALAAEHQASLRSVEDHHRLSAQKKAANTDNNNAVAGIKTNIAALTDLAKAQLKSSITSGDRAPFEATIKRLTTEYGKLAAASGQASLAQFQYSRLLQGGGLIADKNAAAVSTVANALSGQPKTVKTTYEVATEGALADIGQLIGILHSVPKSTKTQILAEAGSAQNAIRAFRAIVAGVPAQRVVAILANTNTAAGKVVAMRALIAGVPASKVASIVANTTGKPEVDALNQAIAQVHSTSATVSVTTTQKQIFVTQHMSGGKGGHASGRGPGGAETAWVGEGHGPEWVADPTTGRMVRIDHPTLISLAPTEYVIPTDPAMSGVSFGLIKQLAAQMGIGGYAGGRAAKAKLPVPAKFTAGAVDESSFSSKTDDARNAYQKREQSIHDLEGKVKDARKAVATAKATKGKGRGKRVADAQAKLDDLTGKLHDAQHGGHGLSSEAALKAQWLEDKRDLAALHATNQKIERLNTMQETDRQKMANAAGAHNVGAYTAAQKDRNSLLGQLQGLYQTAHDIAVKFKDPVSQQLAADLAGKVEGTIGDLQDTAASFDSTQGSAGTFTDAQQALIDQASKDIALAALTTGFDDDKAGGQELVDVLSGILNTDLGNGTPNAAIADIAGQLKSAKDNLKSLTDPNNDPDLQAQLDQANARRVTAEQSAAVNAAVLAAFAGPGDIGVGGSSAQKASMNVTFSSLVAPTPQQALQAAQHIATGFGFQGSVGSPRTNLGI